ncbi:flagellar biosynthetic protein FlhB [Buttiauxella sp. JUb87]|jgi:flagellar biosynthetic protein FlhB|uniref:flagellar biosynthesis protein FlhB n=1 Tax=unclassified Buttiauxella TaxID=2634062 RepID=UPI0010623542|nr:MULTISPECIES: flagellar biosynthesis protein FlhB [unclassified Buttiauxella]TDN49791.1 flagellar biosynthetic protein FlhB [Buttiauxella sp. JUb87]
MSTEKTEKPSSHRLDKARAKGQIPRAKDLAMAISLVAISSFALPLFTQIGEALKQIMAFNLSLTREEITDPAQMARHLGHSLFEALLALLPLAGFIVILGIVAHIMMGGWNFSLDPLLPRFSKISPMTGFKRIFGVQSLVEFAKSVMKIVLITATVLIYTSSVMAAITALYYTGLKDATQLGIKILVDGMFYMALAMLVIGMFDAPYQLWNHLRGLRMSKQELKEEHKNLQGNPEIKGRIRRIQMSMAMRSMRRALPEANVVLTNPTHYAVAIKYDPEKCDAPFVIAKGEDHMALQMRSLAQSLGVEVLEIPALARSVYYTTRVNQQVPPGLYVIMAQILHHVLRLKAFRLGKGDQPAPLSSVEIPDSLRY